MAKSMNIEELSDGTFTSHAHEHEPMESCGKSCGKMSHGSVGKLASAVKEHFGGVGGDGMAKAESKGKGGASLHELNDKFNAKVKGSSKPKKMEAEED